MSQAVLVIGSGGREHALAWKLAQSPDVSRVIVAPGNGGTTWEGDGNLSPAETVNIAVSDFAALIELAKSREVALTVVGPEVPLADGIVDAFEAVGLRAFGVSQAVAQLEASKAFARQFMTDVAIPSPIYGTFETAESAKKFIRDFAKPLVVKASGLAAGKGVLICETVDSALEAVDMIMAEHAFGSAGDSVVIEELLIGEEFSVLAFCDGKIAVPMMIARDHKRALDGDQGLNTGGMGAYAPTSDLSAQEIQYIQNTVLQATVSACNERGMPFQGVLYAGIMRTAAGIKVLEFNCRFGDPETQVVLPMLKTDLFAIMNACIDGTLDSLDIQWHEGACATVVLASGGYPDSYPKGLPITIGEIKPERIVFHAGTALNAENVLVTAGGRVLNVTAKAASLDEALNRVYEDIDSAIYFEKMHYRRDIGSKHRESIL